MYRLGHFVTAAQKGLTLLEPSRRGLSARSEGVVSACSPVRRQSAGAGAEGGALEKRLLHFLATERTDRLDLPLGLAPPATLAPALVPSPPPDHPHA